MQFFIRIGVVEGSEPADFAAVSNEVDGLRGFWQDIGMTKESEPDTSVISRKADPPSPA